MDTPSAPTDRLRAFGNQLIDIHLRLRDDLDRVYDALDGEPGAPRDLRAHCLAFCAAVTSHHTGEDAGAFRVLGARVPELRPVLAELERDHHVVADALRAVQALLDDPSTDPARLRAELDGVAALLETHFRYEEKKLVTALDALTDGTTEGLFGLSLES
ncbi:hemerythrin domain-containing protein [Umezawaea tangerina]|uniref:hemerythrin domain-containing protein n=1 Tax=Umezawaea tangerina TaxID=84725 RepID=UPI000AC17684|nr:hemerythrin domain-containing protein [Umezawaea tangerina]